ncbi:hypothetical protein BDQ17DRAFT_882319 [Cyathus striatus]|nr:hypothetical protein BDQ17DRAFT_882319 [Cyathus striatus]
MGDFTVVDPKGWEHDLHSINNIPWYERSWGHLFSSFEEFLTFSWPVITVTDAWTGRAHIVTRLTSIGAFLKMIKTRFGETLPQAPNILHVTPFETSSRHLRHISDYPTYKRLHSTLPAAVLSALKTRVRAGEPKAIKELWEKRDKTFLAIDFEWSERNEKSCLEWGYAAVRCGHLEALGHWPPVPDSNYRKGHFIVAEYIEKSVNKYCPNHPWQYAFGDSQVAPKAKLPQIIQAIISFASPDSETTANSLVLVLHGIHGDLARMEEMKIKIPHNVLIIDTAMFERVLYSSGHRGMMLDPKMDRPRAQGSTLSLENLLLSFTKAPVSGSSSPASVQVPPIVLPQCVMHNAGNDAFMCLFALQMLLEPEKMQVPAIKKTRGVRHGVIPMPIMIKGRSPMMAASVSSPGMLLPRKTGNTSPSSPSFLARPSSTYDLASEFGQMNMSIPRSSSAPYLTAPNAAGVRNSKRLSVLPAVGTWR